MVQNYQIWLVGCRIIPHLRSICLSELGFNTHYCPNRDLCVIDIQDIISMEPSSDMQVFRQILASAKRVVILAGAGLSASSGFIFSHSCQWMIF